MSKMLNIYNSVVAPVAYEECRYYLEIEEFRAVVQSVYQAFCDWGNKQLSSVGASLKNEGLALRKVHLTDVDLEENQRSVKFSLTVDVEYIEEAQGRGHNHCMTLDISEMVLGNVDNFKLSANPKLIKKLLKSKIKACPVTLPKSVSKLITKILTVYLLFLARHFYYSKTPLADIERVGLDHDHHSFELNCID